MKKQKLKTNKGITLIALIITIIVLLILATVSVKLIVDNGIVGRSKSATSKYKVAEEKELIQLAYSDYKMEKAENGSGTLTVEGATVSGDETSGWTITFNKTGNGYTLSSEGKVEPALSAEEQLDLLKRYFLGKNENGATKVLEDVMNMENMTFKDIEGAVIPDGSTKFAFLNVTTDTEHGYVIFKYENKAYELQVDINIFENQAVELVYEPQGREGQKVKYSYDGTPENEKEWTILYDYGDTVEIIATEVMERLVLGESDEEAQNVGDIDKNGEANTHADKTIYSYNNMISKLNKNCASLVTNKDKISVRSVGSNPNNPNAEGEMYTSERLSQWLEGKYNGIVKGADNNAEQDILRMSLFEVAATGEDYWLASRIIIENPNNIYFSGGSVSDMGRAEDFNLFYIYENGVNCTGSGFYVRPVVKISSDSIKY